jgi:hypothetical protein
MLKNGVERKKDYAIIFSRAKGKVYSIKVSYDQLELLEKIGGKIQTAHQESHVLSVGFRKRVSLRTLIFGHDPIFFKNGDKSDFRPDNIELKPFKLEEFLSELEV